MERPSLLPMATEEVILAGTWLECTFSHQVSHSLPFLYSEESELLNPLCRSWRCTLLCCFGYWSTVSASVGMLPSLPILLIKDHQWSHSPCDKGIKCHRHRASILVWTTPLCPFLAHENRKTLAGAKEQPCPQAELLTQSSKISTAAASGLRVSKTPYFVCFLEPHPSLKQCVAWILTHPSSPGFEAYV